MGLVTCLRPVSPAHAPEPGRYRDWPPEGEGRSAAVWSLPLAPWSG